MSVPAKVWGAVQCDTLLAAAERIYQATSPWLKIKSCNKTKRGGSWKQFCPDLTNVA